MVWSRKVFLFLGILFLAGSSAAWGLRITAQNPTLATYVMETTESVIITFDEGVDPDTLTLDNFYITLRDEPDEKLAGNFSTQGRIVTFTPDVPLAFGVRYEIHITSGLRSLDGESFDGDFPFGAQFVANMPNDLQRFDPEDLEGQFRNSNVLLGFDPTDPEGTDPAEYYKVPGMGATEAWKYSIGRPDVIIAVVDNGMERYWYEETMDNFFLNRHELPLPNIDGTPCEEYDCNGDGRFNVRDYDQDNRIPEPENHPISPAELIEEFSDGVDDDANGLTDDICGWDFLRGVNEALGVKEFDEGAHGEDRARDAAGIANNGEGDKPGFCPNCTILPVRTSDAIMGEYNNFGRGVTYAMEMGADVVCAASGTPNYTREVDEVIASAYEEGMIIVAAIGDELGFHHSYPAAAEDVLSVKSIFPIPPVEFLGVFPMENIAFAETYCTNYGAHLHLAGSSGACSSEATGNISGAVGLLISRARDLMIEPELSANEIKQLLTMTADDIYERCITLTGGGCQEGWDEHFGYGRPNLARAILALGDPDTGLPEQIPPEVRITSPLWYTLVDPMEIPSIDVEAKIHARGRVYTYVVEYATGAEPLDNEYTEIARGNGTAPLEGKVASLNVQSIFDSDYLNKVVDDPDDFTVWLRIRAQYDGAEGPILGEHRKTIAVHRDKDEQFGLINGFPLNLGASGESSPLIIDLDGAPGGNPEIVFGTSDGLVEAFTYDPESDSYVNLPGWPVSIRTDPAVGPDIVVGSVAVGDLFGTGTPFVVVTAGGGLVFAIHSGGNLHLDADGNAQPILDGFPVYAEEPPNDSALAYGHGRSFGSSPVLADLDLDGILEIIATNYDGNVYVWKPVDLNGDGFADPLTGFPVLAQSTKEQVGEEKWCPGEDGEEQRPAQILATPAVGPLDPTSSDPELSQYPAIIVPTTEVCHEKELTTGRVYAIHHDGYANESGSPFVEDFPIVMDAPLSGALPIPPLTIGITSSPAMAYDGGRTHIGITPFAWFPQVIRYNDGDIHVQIFNSEISINGAGHVSFGRMNGDEDLYYVMPTLSGIKKVDGWISMLRPLLMSWPLYDPGTPVLRHNLEDIHFFINPVLADLDGDGMQEALAGSSGFVFHAVDNLGRQPESYPKFTNNWIIASPAVGDTDGDGKMEVFLPTHEGNVFAWNTASDECRGEIMSAQWRKFHHDEWNTGVYGKDTMPPRKITDLEVWKDENGWVLDWTAPGDDRGCGFVQSYDIRYSKNAEDLTDYYSFTSALRVDVKLAPEPLPGGTEQMLHLALPHDEYYFAIQTVDDAGNLSMISNIAPEHSDTGDDDDVPEDDDDDDDDSCGCS